ncbi:hypothetical protein IL306_011959 [Fusarium sp. DS 682]|nr:hypothetical protein IL306_011959 [Fusarium sp. DS 682]
MTVCCNCGQGPGWIRPHSRKSFAAERVLKRIDAVHEEYLRRSQMPADGVNQAGVDISSDNSVAGAWNDAEPEDAEIIPFMLSDSLKKYWADTNSAASVSVARRYPNLSTTVNKCLKFVEEDELEWVEPFHPNPDRYANYKIFYDFGASFIPIFYDAGTIKAGGTGQVSRVQIKMDHFKNTFEEEEQELAYAVKKFCNGAEDYFREFDALIKLTETGKCHPHIVSILASYRMEDRFHLVFPLARCDLAMYWSIESPFFDWETIEWFGGQFRGLADALTTIHRGYRDSEELGPDIYGVHGDIKPQNILCFGSDTKWTSLAFTDFGSSYFLTPDNPEIPRGLKHTPVYRAPEVDTTSDGVTQAYDIWSLGCVFAEAIMWLLEGHSGVVKLTKVRLDEGNNNPNRDAFFRLKYDKIGSLTATIKPKVQRVSILYLYSRL